MNISFVGAGIGSLYAALLLTHKYPSLHVTIYEKESRVGDASITSSSRTAPASMKGRPSSYYPGN
ncbi:NAD(P)-binding protein [Exiguobacterium mexicanum]|uniref:NAD(P)-binding protein n=1 Tax=Exiguobacterium mexicanum TaxID=340146 RepID=UPI0037BEC074